MEVKNKGSTDKGATWEPIAVDADGHVKVDQASELPAGTKKIGSVDVASYPVAGLLNKVVGTVEDHQYASKTGSGGDVLDSSAVPAGKMWVITAIYAFNNDANMTKLELDRLTGGVGYLLKQKKDPIQYDGIDWQGSVVLKALDKIRSTHYGGAAGNSIHLYIVGYEITPP